MSVILSLLFLSGGVCYFFDVSFGVSIGIVLGFIVLAFIVMIIIDGNKEKNWNSKIKFYKNKFLSEDDKLFEIINDKKFITIGKNTGSFTVCKVIDDNTIQRYITHINNIISFDIIENELSVFTYDRGSQFLGAAVGGVLLGSVGAIIGSTAGEKIGTQYCNSLKLKLIFNDLDHMKEEISFLQSSDPKNGSKKESLEYKIAFNKIEEIINTLTILMKKEFENNIVVATETVKISNGDAKNEGIPAERA